MRSKEIARGAEAIVYEARAAGIKVLLKVRAQKKYRASALDVQLRSSRTKREAGILARAMANGVRVPALIGVSQYAICMELVNGRLMKDARMSDAMVAGAGRILAALHNAGISHGDFTPANIIVERGGALCVIDFGLSELTYGDEERALDILLMKRQISKALYGSFIRSYLRTAKGGQDAIRRLAHVEGRGRYQPRAPA